MKGTYGRMNGNGPIYLQRAIAILININALECATNPRRGIAVSTLAFTCVYAHKRIRQRLRERSFTRMIDNES